ncbi:MULTISPECIES: hypothetical protein [Shewanella]|uniref:hypothetical protein n=1 Tax=Shewanella TaxID=22 RepID=UPI0021BF58B1|nr:hypothetical protein [Shewanella xiamenensis]MCT8865386.1 hypothetical protein [Shewanella xiamenensis]
MNAYTVSRLALDAGVSVHIVRDYLLRGLLRQFVERRREALANLEVQLAAMPTAPAQHAESLP